MNGRFVTENPERTETVLTNIGEERERQEIKWGPQSHPDGTANDQFHRAMRDRAIAACNKAAADGKVTWRDILTEESHEAYAETDLVRLRSELIQVAAVATAWIEDIDSRG